MNNSTLVALAVLHFSLFSCNSTPAHSDDRAELEEALAAAGDNRTELEAVLAHFRVPDADPLMYDAASFLIRNMPEHGYVEYTLRDEDGNDVAFDALEYGGFGEAEKALDALEIDHGPLDFEVASLTLDLEVVEANFLITHIEKAFEAWRSWPWARQMSYETFREHILPYRGSNEPLEDWRTPLMARLEEKIADLEDQTDPRKAAGIAGSLAGVGFRELYYLHPTDQGFEEMDRKRVGRCEDITNMNIYAMRAGALASAQDYTPHWANRDNNHAWSVMLDENGKGRAGLSNVAAKIYRKTFSHQPDSLGYHLLEGEKGPRWLNRHTYQDVTEQYLPTTDITVELANEVPAGARFGYLCVFNGGEWKAIHWGWIEDGHVTFDRMGRGVAYLPAYYVDETVVPAAPPFFLDKEERTTTFVGDVDSPVTCELAGKEGVEYELLLWKDGWSSAERRRCGADPMRFEGLPAGGLFWLVADGSKRLERIFTVDGDGTPRFM